MTSSSYGNINTTTSRASFSTGFLTHPFVVLLRGRSTVSLALLLLLLLLLHFWAFISLASGLKTGLQPVSVTRRAASALLGLLGPPIRKGLAGFVAASFFFLW